MHKLPGIFLLLAIRSVSGQIVIDDFNAGDFSVTGPASVSQTSDPSHILTGTRQVDLQDSIFQTQSTASLNSADGYLQYTRNQAANFSLTYGQFNNVAAAPAYDLWGTGGRGFELTFTSMPGTLPTSVTLLAESKWNPGFTEGAIKSYVVPLSGVLTVSFLDLGEGSTSLATFYSSIYAIEIGMDAQSSQQGFNGPGTYQLGNFSTTTVPEIPSSFLVSGSLGLLVVTRACRSRRASRRR
jgi:hypothetical protein